MTQRRAVCDVLTSRSHVTRNTRRLTNYLGHELDRELTSWKTAGVTPLSSLQLILGCCYVWNYLSVSKRRTFTQDTAVSCLGTKKLKANVWSLELFLARASSWMLRHGEWLQKAQNMQFQPSALFCPSVGKLVLQDGVQNKTNMK